MTKELKLYKIWQEVNNDYDTYDSAVVCASTPTEARYIDVGTYNNYSTWAHPKDVKVEYIGKAKRGMKKGIIVDSFNAG